MESKQSENTTTASAAPKRIITIQTASQPDGYWINSRFVFAANWEISKLRFTDQEQEEFETYCKINKIEL